MPWRQRRSCRPEDHSGHLGPGPELPGEANARFPERRALEHDHVTPGQESGRGRSAQDRGLFRGQDVAGAAGVRKAAFAAERHRPVPGLSSAELPGRHARAAAGRAQLRIPGRRNARLCRRAANQQPRHAEIHANADRARTQRHRALSLRAVTGCPGRARSGYHWPFTRRSRTMKTRIWPAIGAGALFSLSAVAQTAPEVTLTRIECGTGAKPTNVAERFTDTFAYKDLNLTFTFSCYLIRHGDEYMVWDTGFAPGSNPNAPKVGIVERLSEVKVKPEQVNTSASATFAATTPASSR